MRGIILWLLGVPVGEYRGAYDYIDREGERSMKVFIDL